MVLEEFLVLVRELFRKSMIMFTNMGAEIVETKEWGMRDLAYAIEDFTKGYYVVMTVNSSIEAKNEFDRLAGISEDVIRYIAIKEEE